MFYYGLLQLLCWWICHVGVLATCVLISLLVPLLPVLVTISHDVVTNGEEGVGTAGFTITRFPPLLCTSIAAEATFYSLVLLLILMLDAGLALLIIMFWFVHKVSFDYFLQIWYAYIYCVNFTVATVFKHTH